MSWWSIIDLSGWPSLQEEPRGKRTKHWVSSPDGSIWLRKEHRSSRPFEPAIEAFTLELARRCGLDVSHGRACFWQNPDGTLQRGFASQKFHDDDEEQFPARELLELPSDSRAKVPIVDARRALEELKSTSDLVTPFVKMLVYDAWVGNGDRHLGNWAVLRSQGGWRFAPIYDTASCLGAELVFSHRHLIEPFTTLDDYVVGCRSGFGERGTEGVGTLMAAVLTQLRTWPEWEGVAAPLAEQFAKNLNVVDELLYEVPSDWLPPVRQRFARGLLAARVKMLQGPVAP